MEYKELLVSLNNRVLHVQINRPQKLNALNKQVLAELADIFASVQQQTEVGGILLSGVGDKAFVAGADIAEFQYFGYAEAKQLAADGQKQVFDAIANCSKPVVAAINGFALGGGLELSMACHLRIASDTARMGLPETGLGLIPGYGGTQRLAQLVGKGRAMELIFTGEMINATRAYEIGLVNKICTPAELLSEAERLLHKINQRAPLAIAGAIKAINAGFDSAQNGFIVEIEEFARCFDTADAKEGVEAFLSKRQANFTGK